MTSIDLDQVYRFLDITHQLREVQRKIHATKTERMENDAEHQYQMALVVWYLNDSMKLNMNTGKLTQYALIHDFVEVYAGDVGFFDPQRDEKVKKEKEKQAAQRLKREFPEFEELHQMIDRYESQADPESRFVHAMDKLLPIWNTYLDDGRAWKRMNVTLPMVIEKKKSHMEENPAVKAWFEETIQRLKKEEDRLFPTTKNEIRNH